MSAYNHCVEGKLGKKRPGIWEKAEDFETSGRIYFSCPHCAFIMSFGIHDRFNNSDRLSDGYYFSLNCQTLERAMDGKRSEGCYRHLWIHFKGLKLPKYYY